MRLYLKTNTYLSRDCHLFWEKLRYALPQKPLVELLKGKETKWKDGWSGLEALAEAQNEAHKKAMRQCQLQNGVKMHLCQGRRPQNCHVLGVEKHCNNTQCFGDQKNNEDQLAGGKDEDIFSSEKCGEMVHDDILKRDNVIMNIVVSDYKKSDESETVSEITKLLSL